MKTRKSSILLRALEVWLLMSVAETLHGSARISLLQPLVGDFRARQIGVFTGSLIILAITVMFRRWIPLTTKGIAAAVGGVWLVMTMGFEFVLGRIAMDLPWSRLLEDYDITRGGLMPFGLMFMFVSPFIGYWLNNRVRENVSANGHTVVRSRAH